MDAKQPKSGSQKVTEVKEKPPPPTAASFIATTDCSALKITINHLLHQFKEWI